MSMNWQTYELSEATVDRISKAVQESCDRLGNDSREKQRLRLSAEEILLRLLDEGEPGMPIEAGIGRRFGKEMLILRYAGPALDPTGLEDDSWNSRILRSLGISPVWSYRGHMNHVSVTLSERVRHGSVYGILIALAAAAVFGLLGRLAPETLRAGLDSILLTPISNCFLGLLKTFAGLMVVFAVISGIVGMSDISALRRTGKKFLVSIVLLCAAASVIALGLSIPLLRPTLSQTAQTGFTQAGKISEMLFAIPPTDPITPFVSGNTLQVIVIAVFVGIGLLALGDHAPRLQELVNEATELFSRIMIAVCRLIPIYVFTALLHQFLVGEAKTLLSAWKPIVIFIGFFILYLALMLLITSRQTTCPVLLLIRKILPPFLVAFTTASSVAAFQAGMETGCEKLGIGRDFLRFTYPIGAVLYMPVAAGSLIVLAVFFSTEYALPVNVSWCIIALITSTVLSIAAPPVAGAGLMIYSTLFAQLDIPAEALLLTVLINIVYDYFVSGGNVATLLIELTREADKLKLLDRAVLRQPVTETAQSVQKNQGDE